MSETVASSDLDHAGDGDEAPQRLHPAFMLTGLGKAARGAFGIIAAAAYFAGTGRWWALTLMVGIYVAFSILSLVLRWLHFSYRVGDEEIVIASGLISTQQRSIPYDRIQDVNIEQGPVARLIGIARVKLETGASAGGKTDDGVLEAVALERAQALRDRIRAYRAGGVAQFRGESTGDATVIAAEADSDRPVFAMSLARVLHSGIYSFSLAIFAVLGGLFQAGGDIGNFNFFRRAVWNQLVDRGSPIADFIVANRWVAAVAGLVSLLFVGLATGLVTTLLRDYGFTLTRNATGLRRRRGLLTLTDVAIPVRRVQAAILATGPFREMRGWSALKLQSLARDEGRQGDHLVAPFAQPEEIDAVLGEVAMALPPADTAWRRVDRGYATIFALALALPLAITLVVGALVAPPAYLASLGILVVMAIRFLQWRRYRYALSGGRILIGYGIWRRRTIILPMRNLQSVDIAHNILTRACGIAALRFGVAGGSGLSTHEIAALPRDDAYALRRDLLGAFA